MKKVKNSSHIQLILLGFSALFLLTIVVLPLIMLFRQAFEGADGSFVGFQNFITYFTTSNMRTSLTNTLFVSTITTIISVTLAFFYAYAISRTNMRGKGFFRFTSMLPLFAPTVMLGIGLIYLLGNQGILTRFIGLNLPLYGSFGIITALSIFTFPSAFLVLLVSFSFADNRLYEAADVMGTSTFKKFRTITLPSVKYGLISSIFIAFSLSFTDFGAPRIVGGSYNVLATDIFRHVVGQQNFNMGAVAGVILLLPAILSFVVDRLTQTKNTGTVTSKTVEYKIKLNKVRDIGFTAYCIAVNFIIFLVLSAVLFASLVEQYPWNMSLTFRHYVFNSFTAGGITSYFNSLLVATLTAIIGTILVFLNAYLIEKTRRAKLLRQGAYFLSILPLALPGLAIGISFIFFFNSPNNPLNFVFGTMMILVLANLANFYSVPFVTATSSLKKLDKEFEFVSESMRVPAHKTFFKVTVPMCFPAILEIAVYFFVNAMVTVSAAVFLVPAHFPLASIAIINLEDTGNSAPAAALSVLIILTNIIVRLGYEFTAKKLKKRTELKGELQNV
ncbi:MAG: putative 2-aminoethylphosphonate ABC transporter permease subunit [Oscillospiraceae bacterium]|nr:putative 2-aminoethylphosphonate ABC transporter permease subunit [Oscillospiraceae bacterium]